jgi:hypothetical protein
MKVSVRKSQRMSIPPVSSTKVPTESPNKENHDFSFSEEKPVIKENKDEIKQKKDGLVMSTARINGTKRESLPDYLNEITRKRLATLKLFEYNKSKY